MENLPVKYDTLVFAVFYVQHRCDRYKCVTFLHKYLLFYYRVYVTFPSVYLHSVE